MPQMRPNILVNWDIVSQHPTVKIESWLSTIFIKNLLIKKPVNASSEPGLQNFLRFCRCLLKCIYLQIQHIPTFRQVTLRSNLILFMMQFKLCRFLFFFHVQHLSITAFLLGRVAGSAALGGLEMPRGFHQPLTALRAPHQDGSKPDRRCNHATWSFADLRVCSQQGLLCQSSLGHSVKWPSHRSQGRIQEGAIGAIVSPKTEESNFVHHNFVQFGKQNPRYKAISLSIVLSQQFCEAYFVSLSNSSEVVMRLDYQILLKSPPP